MYKRSGILALLLGGLLLLWAAPVLAGGWATVGVTEMPPQIYAGQPFTVEFMVWQHGKHAVHELAWDNDRRIPLQPRINLTNEQSGETIRFAAERGKIEGLFVTEILIPAAGEWNWEIIPDPLAGVSELEPLEVLPAPAAITFPEPDFTTFAAEIGRWAGIGALGLLLGVTLLAVAVRQRSRTR